MSPFRSFKQQAYMFKHHPKIAKEWADKYGALKKPKGYKARGKKKKVFCSNWRKNAKN